MATGNQREIEEELRLTYVAMTRARDFLYVLWPLRYYHKSRGLTDSHSYAQCCRFFTDEVIRTIDQPGLTQTGEYDNSRGEPVMAQARVDISGRIKDIWK
jgi:DNA helicase-2/ATP-dependent DNA helicase PcrA